MLSKKSGVGFSSSTLISGVDVDEAGVVGVLGVVPPFVPFGVGVVCLLKDEIT